TVELREEDMNPGQRMKSVTVEEGTVALRGESLEIRLPVTWARKLILWADGLGRNILCNADIRRFNLVGATKMGERIVLTYVDRKGGLKAETVSREFLPVLEELLKGSEPRPGKGH
ncbi:MAG: hypothetical protein ACE5HJ_08780, partial [Thermoplasmata archaeon]